MYLYTIFSGETFREGKLSPGPSQTAKFVKVFSLESFPLYGTCKQNTDPI